MADRVELLKRIKKCMALAKSANEHEAAAALAKARALMDVNDVSPVELEMADITEASARGSGTKRSPRWESLLCASVRRALGVEVIIGANRDRIYFGFGAEPEIAAYAFTVLFRNLKKSRADYIRAHLKRCTPARKRQRADVYCEAWATEVYAKVRALVPEKAPSKLIEGYIGKRFAGELTTVSNRAASWKGGRLDQDYWRGRDAGAKVNLSQGVGAAAAPLVLKAGHG